MSLEGQKPASEVCTVASSVFNVNKLMKLSHTVYATVGSIGRQGGFDPAGRNAAFHGRAIEKMSPISTHFLQHFVLTVNFEINCNKINHPLCDY